jgi:hypothetical protein
MNNKGFAKTLEAGIAVILVLVFIFYVLPKQAPEQTVLRIPENVDTAQSFILQEISTQEDLRNCALYAATTGKCEDIPCQNIFALITSNTPAGYSSACEICATANTCATNLNLPTDVSLYTDSVFLSDRAASKIVRVYFWKRQ